MKRGLNHKNSLPDPEFGRESSESARAIHYVVQKDVLMTYVSALIAQADLRKLRGSTIERKQMSTKTIYKRIALVAVASLGAGLLSVAPANAAAVTGSAVIGPIRASFTGTTQDVVAAAAVTITATGTAANAVAATGGAAATPLLNTVALTTAPTAAAVLTIAQANVTDGASASLAVTASGSGAVTLANSRTLTAASTAALITTAQAISGITFKVDTPGTYSGTITTAQVGGGNTLVTPFTFTTRGAPTSYDFTTTTAGQTSSAVSGAISVTVTLRDAANNITQGSTVDTIALTAAISAGGTVGTFADPGDGAGIVRATDLADGTSAVVYTNSVTAGSTSTLTATPRGTLGGLGAKTLAVTTVVANTGVPSAAVTVSNTIVKASTSTSVLNKYTVSTNQTSVTFNVTGLTPNTSFSYDLTASAGTFTSVNGAAYSSGNDLVGVSTATGTFSVVSIADTPATQTVTLDLNTADVADVTGQVDADYTYAAPAYAVTVTTPAAGSLFATSSAITYTGKVADQFGNVLAGASVLATGTPTPATSPSTITATATTAADGTFTVSLAAVAATTTSISTVVSATSAASITSASANVSYFTASGKAATLVLTDTDTAGGAATVDNKSTRVIPKTRTGSANDGVDDLIDADVANTDNQVSITPQTTSPGTIGYTATATNGIRLSTSNMDAALVTGSSITGTGGTAFFAVPTKVGDGVITVVSGGLTQTFTLTGVLPTTPRANLVTLTAGTTAGLYTVTTTDGFGNGVSANVAVSVAGPGQFSNGFKNLTITTTAAGTNTFTVVSAVASATTITASIAGDTNYTALVAADVTTYGLVAASAAATATLAGIAASTETNTLATLTTLVNSLIAKINALNKLVLKIQKKVRA